MNIMNTSNKEGINIRVIMTENRSIKISDIYKPLNQKLLLMNILD